VKRLEYKLGKDRKRERNAREDERIERSARRKGKVS